MEVSYVNLTQMKRQWSANNENIADVTDAVMMDFARRVSVVVDVETQMEFIPRIDTRKYNVDAKLLNGDIDNVLRNLYLSEPIVELTSVTLADTTSLTVDTDVRLFPAGGQSPAVELQLSQDTNSNWYDKATTGFDDISVVGIWCWRDRYSTDGWQLSGDAVADSPSVSASATSIKVSDPDGTNYFNDTPRFDPGQMIKIDDEYMAVVDTDTEAPKNITVIRGIRGSTTAIHLLNAAISVYYPQPDIVRAAQLIAHYNYARRGRIDRITFDGVATTEIIEIPREAQIILERYKPRGL